MVAVVPVIRGGTWGSGVGGRSRCGWVTIELSHILVILPVDALSSPALSTCWSTKVKSYGTGGVV